MESKSEHVLKLASEIIDDIELSSIDGQGLLLKATRLARYIDNSEVRKWLKLEMQGYKKNDVDSLKYMNITGRWVNKEKGTGFWYPLSQVEARMSIEKMKMGLMTVPDSGSDGIVRVASEIMKRLDNTSIRISRLGGIKSRVISLIHDFATSVYYEKTFDCMAESIFDSYKKDIDTLIADHSGDIVQQIPSVIARLSENTTESISQALTTCRRIIDSFADYICPPSDETFEIGGNHLSLKKDKVQNRINVFVFKNSTSVSRKKRIRQNIANLYDRVSVGVHNDVTAVEARNLFLNVYLLLGEVLSLKKITGDVKEKSEVG